MATFGTFTTGQVLTAAELNALGVWTSFTPTWTGVTVGNGTNTGVYTVINKMLFVKVKIVFGTTSVMTGFPQITLPNSLIGTTANQLVFGTANCDDTGIAAYPGSCYLIQSNAVRAYVSNTAGTYASLANITSTVPMTWSTGDVLYMDFMVQIN